MKRFRFLQVALVAALVVAAVSCGMPRSVSDEYYDDYPQGYGYYGSPYDNRPVILQRDPFTGRYYEVTPYGAYAYPAVPYGYNRGYSRDYNRNYRNRDNDNRNRNNGYNGGNYGNRGGYNGYNNNNNRNNGNSGQTDQQRQQNREEARKRILGESNNH